MRYCFYSVFIFTSNLLTRCLREQFNGEFEEVANANGTRMSRDETSLPKMQAGHSPGEGPVRNINTRQEKPRGSVINTGGNSIANMSGHDSQSSRIYLTKQGRVYFKEASTFGSKAGSGDESSFGNHPSTFQIQKPPEDSSAGGWANEGLSGRRRLNTGLSQMSVPEGLDQWERVQQIIMDDEVAKGVSKAEQRHAFSGVWRVPTVKGFLRKLWDRFASMRKRTKGVVEDFASESTFAVVTFTSRQAAIAGKDLSVNFLCFGLDFSYTHALYIVLQLVIV